MSIDRNERVRIIYRAEALELRTKEHGKRNGALGAIGLTVLRVLLFRFAPCPTPTFEQIRSATGLCLQAIADALTRLEAAGLIRREHRSYRTPSGHRKAANRYHFPAQLGLPLLGRPQRESKESKKLSARIVPFAELTGPLRDALDRLAARMQLTG